MSAWTFQPILPTSAMIIVALVMVGLLLVGPAFSKISRLQKFKLALIRLAVVMLALTAMLRPGCIQHTEQSQSAVLLALLDISRSMQLPHEADDQSRWQAVVEMLNQNRDQIDQLQQQQVELRFYGFDNELQPLEREGELVLPGKPRGAETDIGSAVFKASQDVRDERLIGVLLASDGVQNAADPEIELTQATSTLDDLQVPLYSITLGLQGNTGQVADVAITTLAEQHRIAVKNELIVNATVVARGFINQDIPIQLLVTDAEGQEKVVDTQIFQPTEALEQKQISLSYIPTEPGEYRLRVRAEPQKGEVALRNNDLPSFLTVYEGGVRILYLSGNNSWWEQRELRNALRRAAQGFELVYVPIQNDKETRDKNWPLGGQITEYLRDPNFDVIILGDVDSQALFDPNLQTENMQALVEAVDRGTGLMMLGGYHSFDPGQYYRTPLADILPIEMNPTAIQRFPPAPLQKDLHLDRELQLVPTRNHFITSLSNEQDPRQSWSEMPPLKGANRFFGVKDQAEILLETESGQPILVSGQIGGRVLAFAGDSTWRWVFKGKREEHNTFWRQIILWLASKDGVENDTVWIDLPQRRFSPNAFVEFNAGIGNQRDESVKLVAELILPDESTLPLVLGPDGDFERGELDRESLADSGDYAIEITGTRDGVEVGKATADFIIIDRDKEKAISAADPEQMQRLASQTEAHGGRMISPQELGSLLDEIIANPKEMKIEIPLKWRLGESLPDALSFLLLFAGLLSLEWFLRKKWGLV
ncbi:MAG: glutamine amidotransferase [Planctomycetota bacterium]|nr:glutamine amidotransferase [Planctomycetota bacterium]